MFFVDNLHFPHYTFLGILKKGFFTMKQNKLTVRGMILAALFAALAAVLSQISFPIGISPVPFSLGICAVFLTGALLDKKYALIALLVYLLLGAVGLPVFSQFRGGFSVLAGPTGGYLFSYPVSAFLIGLLCDLMKKRNLFTLIVSMLAALAVCYAVGTLWLSFVSQITFMEALAAGDIPFVIPDIVKVVLCSVLATILLHATRKYNVFYKAPKQNQD